jgi:hypothetical protein
MGIIDAGRIGSGVLSVSRGGTGVTGSSGTGSVVLTHASYLYNPVVLRNDSGGDVRYNQAGLVIYNSFHNYSLRMRMILNGSLVPTVTEHLEFYVDSADTRYVYFQKSGALMNRLYVQAVGTFTGAHSCKHSDLSVGNVYMYTGRIVSSTGVLNTKDIDSDNQDEHVKVSDAHPIVKLCNTYKDPTVFGVISDAHEEKVDVDGEKVIDRLGINSLGEGGILVCDEYGPVTNGDYITTSTFPGLGCKQDDDLLHNYTVAKATQSCDFTQGCSYYNNLGEEITEAQYDETTDKQLVCKAKMIACTYHCG